MLVGLVGLALFVRMGQDNSDIIDDSATFLTDPAVPCLLGKSFCRLHGLFRRVLIHEFHRLVGCDELPDSIAAQQKAMVQVLNYVLRHLGLAAATCILMA